MRPSRVATRLLELMKQLRLLPPALYHGVPEADNLDLSMICASRLRCYIPGQQTHRDTTNYSLLSDKLKSVQLDELTLPFLLHVGSAKATAFRTSS